MILSKTAEYTIRVATSLALHGEGQILSADLLSQESNVPLPYLSKILRQLVHAEILSTQKGPAGGYLFKKSLSKINIQSLLEAVQFKIDYNHCAFGWKKCNSQNPCALHDSYCQLKTNYFDWAQKTTLATIVKSQRKKLEGK